MYTLLLATRLAGQLDPLVVAAAVVAALCHDLEHPGYSNVYQSSEKTVRRPEWTSCPLPCPSRGRRPPSNAARRKRCSCGRDWSASQVLHERYDGKSPLENHHCAIFEELLEEHDLAKALSPADRAKLLRIARRMILATDMAHHNQLMSDVREIISKGGDLLEEEEGALCLALVLKCADISNQVRPWRTANRWNARVYEEFYREGDADAAAGRPVTPLHNRDTNDMAKSSVGFITSGRPASVFVLSTGSRRRRGRGTWIVRGDGCRGGPGSSVETR